jgi:hypothetical protein
MGGYKPTKIAGFETGLVQEREEFLLPNDAYPTLENAYVWRERIRRRQGLQTLGRLRRNLMLSSMGNISASGAGIETFNIFTGLGVASTEPFAEIELGNVTPISIAIGAPISQTLTDIAGEGILTIVGAGPITAATINYATGDITLTFSGAAASSAVTFTGAYYPGLPVMGLRSRELTAINNEMTVAFDTKYAYKFTSAWIEFIPGTTWSGSDSDFFWSTNYFVGDANQKIFWVTNFSGTSGDPIRYTNGAAWVNFAPQIDSTGSNFLQQSLGLLPFRGRLLAFNTLEGASLSLAQSFTNRIRWSAIGTPFTTPAAGVVTLVNPNAWRDDIRGQGGFLDIPTSESITAFGFVRDNLVIYCERSTWQLRYTGRSIAPFQIERVNSELGAESTFSAVQFDTSLVGIGDKGIVECDSFKSDRIDIKIPDLVNQFNFNNFGYSRIHGIRDIQQRLAYWTYPLAPGAGASVTYPNRRLVYNYENDSWAIFTDSLTCFGVYQPQSALRWQDFAGLGAAGAWERQNYPWVNRPSLFPALVGGNQQGFVMFLGSNLQPQVSNSINLSIRDIEGFDTTPTVITCPNHNLQTGQVIQISGIPSTSAFAATLNNQIFGIVVGDDMEDNPANEFQLWIYNPLDGQFTIPQTDSSASIYFGGGKIAVRDGFNITSKKFNSLDEGQKIQMGYIDVLLNNTTNGALTMNVYMDYNNSTPINQLPENINPQTNKPDAFFNSTVPTTANTFQGIKGSKNWQRVFCPTRAQFLTIQWTLTNAQLVGVEQQNDVQIDAQVLWTRSAGRLI